MVFGKAYGFAEKASIGDIDNYRVSPADFKTRLRDAVAARGSRWKSVAFT